MNREKISALENKNQFLTKKESFGKNNDKPSRPVNGRQDGLKWSRSSNLEKRNVSQKMKRQKAGSETVDDELLLIWNEEIYYSREGA